MYIYIYIYTHTHTHAHIHTTYIYRGTNTAQAPFKISYDGAVVQACHVGFVFMKPAKDPSLRVRGTYASVVIAALVISCYISTATKYTIRSIIWFSVTITARDIVD